MYVHVCTFTYQEQINPKNTNMIMAKPKKREMLQKIVRDPQKIECREILQKRK
jgi:hypothetical protein